MLITLFSIILWLSCLKIYTYLFKQILKINKYYLYRNCDIVFILFIYLFICSGYIKNHLDIA